MPTHGRFAFLKTKRGASIAIGSLGALAVGAFALVYFVVFPTSSPKAFGLTTPTSTSSSTNPAANATASATDIAGAWKVGTGSKVGYRVREKLAFLPAQSDAVGRTPKVSGSLTLATSGSTVKVTAASFVAAVNTLTSDRSMRDARIHTIGLESDTYPTATFKLTVPFTVPANATKGQVGKVQATGVLTIHGTSKTVAIPLEMSISNSALETTGSLTFPWSEFGMTAPNVGGGAVSVNGKATMEFDLHLVRS
jgi:polyisoprenoid-binding protein YceI